MPPPTKISDTPLSELDQRNAVARIISELATGPTGFKELQEASGLGVTSLRAWLKAFSAQGVMRISGFDVHRAIYALNPEGLPDAKRRRSRGATRTARWRAKLLVKGGSRGAKRLADAVAGPLQGD